MTAMDKSTVSSAAEYDNSATATAIYKAIGFELRMVREDQGWSVRNSSRGCQALGVSASQTLARACQRARLNLETLVLEIDLEALLAEKISPSPILQRWARNNLNRQPSAPAMMTPAAVVGACRRHW
jgi:hypothetical protein